MTCYLCLREAPLKDSHIVPRFVYRWLRESSPTGYLRTSQAPNRRIQDGPTVKLLCGDCEHLLSAWEKQFAERVFVPLHKGDSEPFAYEGWALKFAVSISWRVLVWPEPGRWDHLAKHQVARVRAAAEVWRRFLLGEREHPGDYEQRIIPLNVIESHTTPGLSPFMNRYMTRVVAADLVRGSRTVFTFSKLCRVLVIGLIDVPDRKKWKGGKVHVKRGLIGGPVQYQWPRGFFEYMNHSANLAGAALGKMSDKQSEKLTGFMMKNLERVRGSETFRAMQKDVEFSGPSAFRLEDLNPDPENDDGTGES